MSLAEAPTSSRPLTAEDLMSMPDDGIERDIIRGQLREWPTIRHHPDLSEPKMTRRNPDHSETEMCIGYELRTWLETQPRPRGKVVGGEAGFRLRRDPETFVGIDVAFVSAEMVANRDRKLKFFEGPPVLAVEILSPSDQHEYVVEKVEIYLEVGSVVWVADPNFRTVAVHRSGEPPITYDDQQELAGDPYLPGFRIAVSKLFEG